MELGKFRAKPAGSSVDFVYSRYYRHDLKTLDAFRKMSDMPSVSGRISKTSDGFRKMSNAYR